jgi:uncharacterized membrane protein HdeD (DUF308 family)
MTFLAEMQRAFMLRGLVAVGIGLAAMIWPATVLSVLVVLFGLYVLADGLLLLIAAVRSRDLRWLLGLQGLTGIVIAVVAFVYPHTTIVAAVYLLGVWAIATGLLEVVVALRITPTIPQAGLIGVCGVLSLALGVLLFRAPDSSALFLARLFGTYQLAVGIVMLTLAGRLRQARQAAAA